MCGDSSQPCQIVRLKVQLTGRVQGVGFRPTAYRIATALGLSGIVRNDGQGLTIEVQGQKALVDQFISRITDRDRPPLAAITGLEARPIQPVAGEEGFVIEASHLEGSPECEVCPDMAVCDQCLQEMADPNDPRYAYPFINCTNCGPRYTIIKAIPYDRPNTTMSGFQMCSVCSSQYHDVHDRRFHAQPVACPECGPRVWLTGPDGRTVVADTANAIAHAARMLQDGKVLAVKGIGGFHLMVDATNEQAVRLLRKRKRRDHKPFAMMAASLADIQMHADISPVARQVLTSPQAPIVLLPRRDGHGVAPSVAASVKQFGFMCCYAPLHRLLLEMGPRVVVATSGNISDEPLICDNDLALSRLGTVADGFLMHDRPIYRQVDDSVVHIIDGRPAMLRRARGYVPSPITMGVSASRQVLALGSDLKNTFSLVKDDQIICSEHIGDLADAEVFRHYVRSISDLQDLFDVRPSVLVCDMHPGYVSTAYAKRLQDGFKHLIHVQHHWAHVASVMAEHQLTGPVIGIVADGTGYGTDGVIWGCECLIADLHGFERFGHLQYYALPGGDKAAREPIRPLIGLLSTAVAADPGQYQWILDLVEPDRAIQGFICRQVSGSINVVQTSSLGRVFDAIAAVLGLGRFNHFDAQLPMALEAIASADVVEEYPVSFSSNGSGPVRMDIGPLIEALLRDLHRAVEPRVIAARFHNGIARGLLMMAQMAGRRTGLRQVALSGGVFCNRYLAERLIGLLRQSGYDVYWNQQFPTNDGGISVGQAAIAARLTTATSHQA